MGGGITVLHPQVVPAGQHLACFGGDQGPDRDAPLGPPLFRLRQGLGPPRDLSTLLNQLESSTILNAVTFDNLTITVDKNNSSLNFVRSGASFSWSQVDQDLYLNYAIPEPSTYAMLAMAGIGFAGYVIRRRRR
jgi:hypothetical protein